MIGVSGKIPSISMNGIVVNCSGIIPRFEPYIWCKKKELKQIKERVKKWII